MTESATRKPLLTRRRVIAAAVLLGLVLAVFAIGVFDSGRAESVKVSFIRFERSEDDNYAVAVVKVRNDSKRRYSVIFDDRTSHVVCFFFPTNEDRGMITVMADLHTLKPGQEATGRIYLQPNGKVGRVATRCQLLPQRLPAFYQKVRTFWSDQPPPYVEPLWAESDQEIRCPTVRPDGTVEPPRLMPQREHKP